jgi:hypothetical protein
MTSRCSCLWRCRCAQISNFYCIHLIRYMQATLEGHGHVVFHRKATMLCIDLYLRFGSTEQNLNFPDMDAVCVGGDMATVKRLYIFGLIKLENKLHVCTQKIKPHVPMQKPSLLHILRVTTCTPDCTCRELCLRLMRAYKAYRKRKSVYVSWPWQPVALWQMFCQNARERPCLYGGIRVLHNSFGILSPPDM